MNEELEALQSAIKRISDKQKAQDSQATQALLGALAGVEAALTEIIAMREDEDEDEADDEGESDVMQAAGAIVQAIARISMEPRVEFNPQINVPQAQAPVVNMPAIELKPQFTVPAPEVKVMQAPAQVAKTWKALHLKFDMAGGMPVGCTITRED